MKIFYTTVAILLIISGVIVSYYFFYELSEYYTVFGKGEIKLGESGQVGDFIGGIVGTIFSFAGVVFLILTLSAQSSASFIERFESNFFELLKLHRENVNELHIERKVRIKSKISSQKFTQRSAFNEIFKDFLKCREEVNPFFKKKKEEDIYMPEYLKDLKAKLNLTNPSINLAMLARINIPYCIVFYGVDSEGIMILKRLFEKKYKSSFVEELLQFIQMKPVMESRYWQYWERICAVKNFKKRRQIARLILQKRIGRDESIDPEIDSLAASNFYKNNFVKYYGGNQFRLGHYFRHLFQSFKYVNSQKKLSFKDKYFYAKTLRAQLSTSEQALLFVNSLSFLGLVWDLVPETEDNKFDPFVKSRIQNLRLISNFNLIKNLPGEHIFGIRYKDFYPLVKYEF